MSSEGYSVEHYLRTRIKEDSFDVDLLSQFDLCIQIIDNIFNFCVIDTQSQRCLLLESYELPIYPGRSFKEQLMYIFEDHHFLMAGFWKTVKISINNKQFSLVPYPLFDDSALVEYLRCQSTFDPAVQTLYQYKHELPDSVNVFAVDSELVNWLKSFYPQANVKVVHQTSGLIQGVMKDQQSMSLKTLYLFVYKNYFTLVVKNENTLEYCNIFSYSSAEDFVFYLMFVTSTLNINRKSSKLLLFGEIQKDSAVYEGISKYFKFVAFGEKPTYLKYGYVFDELADHSFFDLYSIYLC